jgi:hypothetical protein
MIIVTPIMGNESLGRTDLILYGWSPNSLIKYDIRSHSIVNNYYMFLAALSLSPERGNITKRPTMIFVA